MSGTITRRRAIGAGTLAALAAGLPGTTTPAEASTPLVVGTITDMSAIVAEVERQIEVVRTHDAAVEEAMADLYDTLSPEQRALFRRYEEADNERDFEQMDLYLLDLGRHLPGLAPAIWALSRHMFESRQGACCIPDGGQS